MGKKIFHLGPNGAGQTVKLAMNLILALQVEALAEALALVTHAGVAGERLVEVLQSSMARAAVLDVKAPLILKNEFPPSFPLRLMHKDMRLALELARARRNHAARRGRVVRNVQRRERFVERRSGLRRSRALLEQGAVKNSERR